LPAKKTADPQAQSQSDAEKARRGRTGREDWATSGPAAQASLAEARDAAAIKPGQALQLQRVIGNRAVSRLIGQGGPAVQLRRFKAGRDPLAEVLAWVDGQFATFQATYAARILDLKASGFFDNYLLRRIGADPLYGGEDAASNQAALYEYQEQILRHVEDKIIGGNFAGFVKKRTLSADHLKHIFQGQISADGKRVTGYHWKGDGTAIAEGYDEETPAGDMGCYTQKVRLIADPDIKKAKESTFFPDEWSRKDVIVAIEYANDVGGGVFEVTKPEKGKGLRLMQNEASYFPYFD
jgi:hypothetical protein